MALAKKQSRNDRIMIIALVVIVVAVIGYFGYTKWYLNRPTNSGQAIFGPSQKVITNFGEELLTDPRVTELRDFGVNINADINDAGQPNPFQ